MSIHPSILRAAAFASLGLLSISAETHPNFSGNWKLNQTLSATPAGGAREIVFRIDHRDPVFLYSAAGRRGYMPFSEAYEFTIDGRMPVHPSKLAVTAGWEGQTLVLKHVKEGREVAKVRWQLSSDGAQMTREVDFGNNSRIREIYERQ